MLLPNSVANVVGALGHLKVEGESTNRVHYGPNENACGEIYDYYVVQICVQVYSVVAPYLASHLRVDLDDGPLDDCLV